SSVSVMSLVVFKIQRFKTTQPLSNLSRKQLYKIKPYYLVYRQTPNLILGLTFTATRLLKGSGNITSTKLSPLTRLFRCIAPGVW
ncbi:MAG TPA: hypothetical protein PKO30_07580, partial [Prolixibacteraceae bacterium]|nr:hypothetical protein [Prolixibacteraceae bacterium]